MNYHEAANFLLDLRRFPPRPGTDATADLLAHLGDPHEDLPCVQIAGSNGKGSTARMLEDICQEAGLEVGLYTSPHMERLRERVRVNGQLLRKQSLRTFVETIEDYVTAHAAAGEAPTFFETVTALALWEFGRQDVDVAILEVGIGGSQDATSVVDPIATAVTSVTLEHTDVLGEDLETIASDMAGIAAPDNPLVTAAEGTARQAIEAIVGDIITVGNGDEFEVGFEYHGRTELEGQVTIDTDVATYNTALGLLGRHQAANAGVAVALAEQVGKNVLDEMPSKQSVETGLRRATWPGRFEVMQRDPLVVLDGAHNPDGCKQVARTVAEFEYDSLALVVGSLADKDHRGIARALADADRVTACEPVHDRAEAKAAIARAFETETEATVNSRTDVAGAVSDAIETAGPDDCILVTGSLYTVAEARVRWSRPRIPKQVDSINAAKAMLGGAHVGDAGRWRMRGKAVHRIVRTRVQPRQAQYLKEELLSLGGECAISGFDVRKHDRVDVVLMGTMAQFKRLCEKLDGQPYGLAPFADELRETLSIGVRPPRRGFPWESRPAIMGIVNVTPDSFHDGGAYDTTDEAVSRAKALVDAGADIVDVGGESTRPGATPVKPSVESERVVPVVERLAGTDTLISVDTRKPTVARNALEAGADMINDVSGLRDPELRQIASEFDVPVVLMHSIETPVDPERDIKYDDVVEDVMADLRERILLAERAGLDRSQIIVDPGIGFGKSAAENFELLERLGEFRGLGCPILVGHSHKSMFEYVGKSADERYEVTVAASALAADRGADVIRVHDVQATADAVSVLQTMREQGY